MGAGRLAGDMEPIGVAAESRCVSVYPRDRAAHLLGHRRQAAVGLLYAHEIERDEMRAGIHEKIGEEGIVFGRPLSPRTAMDEHVDRRIRTRGGEQVERLVGGRAVGHASWCAEPGARSLAVESITL